MIADKHMALSKNILGFYTQGLYLFISLLQFPFKSLDTAMVGILILNTLCFASNNRIKYQLFQKLKLLGKCEFDH